jgi:hypothetical protein
MTLQNELNLVPQYTLNLSKINSPYDICRILKEKNVHDYVYQIIHNGILIKYGMSADRQRNYGERLYRQVSHMESWGILRNTGSSGADFRIIESDYYNKYGIKMDRNLIKIKVFDMTNFPYKSTCRRDEILNVESYLIDEYLRIFGEKPIGNINDDNHMFKKKSYVSKNTIDSIFEKKDI